MEAHRGCLVLPYSVTSSKTSNLSVSLQVHRKESCKTHGLGIYLMTLFIYLRSSEPWLRGLGGHSQGNAWSGIEGLLWGGGRRHRAQQSVDHAVPG